jgi:hypothetical protein
MRHRPSRAALRLLLIDHRRLLLCGAGGRWRIEARVPLRPRRVDAHRNSPWLSHEGSPVSFCFHYRAPAAPVACPAKKRTHLRRKWLSECRSISSLASPGRPNTNGSSGFSETAWSMAGSCSTSFGAMRAHVTSTGETRRVRGEPALRPLDVPLPQRSRGCVVQAPLVASAPCEPQVGPGVHRQEASLPFGPWPRGCPLGGRGIDFVDVCSEVDIVHPSFAKSVPGTRGERGDHREERVFR